MYKGFPTNFVSLLRCPLDEGRLGLINERQSTEFLKMATLECASCKTRFPVVDGIVQLLLDEVLLDDISGHERRTRDQEAPTYCIDAEASDWQQMEIASTLAAMQPLRNNDLMFELGCGTGRFTTRLAGHTIRILAADFSLQALRTLADRVESHWKIGLVQADCTKAMAATNQFNLALSTLVSNLPSVGHRCAMFSRVSNALTRDGKFVFSAHHHGLRARLRGEQQSGMYPSNGIYRYLFRKKELLQETSAAFESIDLRRIQIRVPFSQRFGLPQVALSRFAESLPFVNSLAELLLVSAAKPRS